MKETAGRKHKKESTKDGRDALKIRESIRDGKNEGRSGTRCRVR